jgi:ABC-type multidrug transport system fused ATPase/permease subunit
MSSQSASHSLFELWRVYRQFGVYTRPDRAALLVDAITVAIAVITNTLMIWLLGMPLNLMQQGDFGAVWQVLAWFALVIVINQTMQYAGAWVTNWIGLRVSGRVRGAVIDRVLMVSFPAVGRWAKGDLLARLGNDVGRIRNSIVDGPVYMLSHVLTGALYIFMLFWIDAGLAMLALALTPLFIWQQHYLGKRKRHAAERSVKESGRLTAFEEEALSNLRGVSTATAEAVVANMYRKVFDGVRRWTMKERGVDIAFMVGFSFLIYLTGLVIVYVGIDGVQEGRFGVGHLVSFLLYLGYLTVPARGAADIVLTAFGNLGAAHRVLELLHVQPVVNDQPDAQDLTQPRGAIELHDVSFAYPGAPPLFRNINLRIERGETIALVGPSGSGKSTLALLLLRFYDVSAGRITLDGVDLRDVKLSALRRAVAMVWQEPYLISGTLRENFTLYGPGASDAAIETACRASHAWEFIAALPHGLDTRIGAGGTTLSTGQKQRVALAQALLRDAAVLILDEATSALDSHSERAITEALNEHRAERTTILIAHRYSSLKSAHRVVYFNGDGTITVGRHDGLMDTHPEYRRAVEWQTGTRE